MLIFKKFTSSWSRVGRRWNPFGPFKRSASKSLSVLFQPLLLPFPDNATAMCHPEWSMCLTLPSPVPALFVSVAGVAYHTSVYETMKDTSHVLLAFFIRTVMLEVEERECCGQQYELFKTGSVKCSNTACVPLPLGVV